MLIHYAPAHSIVNRVGVQTTPLHCYDELQKLH